MDVKIETKCGRCERIEEKTTTLELAQALQENEDARKAAAESVPAKLNEVFGEPHYPEVIIAIRTNSGYTVKVLDNLCERPGASRNKGCKQRVHNLVESIFTIEPPKKREPKEPKSKKVKKSDLPKAAPKDK